MPIEEPLKASLDKAQTPWSIGLAMYAQLPQALLGPGTLFEDEIVGTFVLVRLEDWLREMSDDLTVGSARKRLQEQVEEFAAQLRTASAHGAPVWLLCCPSNGYVANRFKLVGLCRTFTNLLAAKRSGAIIVPWPDALREAGIGQDEQSSDRIGQVPYNQPNFDKLAAFVAGQTTQTTGSAQTAQADDSPSLTMENYLRDLDVRVKLAPAGADDASTVEHLTRTVAGFVTNQAIRTESEFTQDLETGVRKHWLVVVSDRLADYAEAGLLFLLPREGELIVENWLLSCTILGKQVEYAVLASLGSLAKAYQCSQVRLQHRATGRNEFAQSFLKKLGPSQRNSDDGTLWWGIQADNALKHAQELAHAPDAWTLEVLST